MFLAAHSRPLRSSNFIGLSDGQIAAVGAGHRAFDEDQVVFGVDSHDFEVPHRDLFVTEVARFADTFLGAGGVGRGRTSRGGGASA